MKQNKTIKVIAMTLAFLMVFSILISSILSNAFF